MATFTGLGAVFGAQGDVAGTPLTGLTQGMELSRDMSGNVMLKGRDGTRKGQIQPEAVKSIAFTVIPTAATLADAKAAGGLAASYTLLVVTNADIASFNGTYLIDKDYKVKSSNGSVVEVSGTATNYTDDGNTEDLAVAIT